MFEPQSTTQEADSQIDPKSGFCIELSCLPDGTFNVSVEPLESEANEPDEQTGQNASSFAEAMKAVVSLYQQTTAEDQESEFQSGFDGKATPVSKPGMLA